MKRSSLIITQPPQKNVRSSWSATMQGVVYVTGYGPTREDAIDDLLRTIRNSLNGEFNPVLIAFKSHIALIWREQDRWYYTIQKADHNGPIKSNFNIVGSTRDETERAARRHLADYAMDDCYHAEEAAEVIIDETDHREFIATAYRTKEVQRIMAGGVDWHQANLIFDGLLKEAEYQSKPQIEPFDVTPALMAAEAREFYTSATGIEEGGF